MFSLFSKAINTQSKAYFSPGDHCLNAIIAQITKAKKSLNICVFTISDDRITQAIKMAHRRGVKVRILTDNEKLLDKGSDIRELALSGISVRIDNTANHMHHKFALLDNQTVLTGSYNWTRSAAMYNHENLLVTNDPQIVNDFSREFDKLWSLMTVFKADSM